MILVDTSVWIEHFSNKSIGLASLLTGGLVLVHPLVIGELACGNLRNRGEILFAMRALPFATISSDEEALHAIERHQLWGRGIGWVDVHLLSSALLSHSALWSLDRRLNQAAAIAGVKTYS